MKTEQKTFTSANIIEAEVGTTGPMGGDAGHGGETYVKLTDAASTAWHIALIDEKGNESVIEQPKTIMIVVQGDTELQTLADSLGWAARKIKELSS